jgi:hypothetical protein
MLHTFISIPSETNQSFVGEMTCLAAWSGYIAIFFSQEAGLRHALSRVECEYLYAKLYSEILMRSCIYDSAPFGQLVPTTSVAEMYRAYLNISSLLAAAKSPSWLLFSLRLQPDKAHCDHTREEHIGCRLLLATVPHRKYAMNVCQTQNAYDESSSNEGPARRGYPHLINGGPIPLQLQQCRGRPHISGQGVIRV